ncbi:MAG TPA: adenylyl-sulfate kinase [Thermoanaerobaculia bacterium]
MTTPSARSTNVVFHPGTIGREQREELLGQRGMLIWLTGLSASGKSTIARGLEARLCSGGWLAYVLDGDNLRHGLNADLGFSDHDREENIRRVGEVGALFVDAGLIAIAAFISPFRRDRERVRSIVGAERFIEVFLDVPLAVCESRDPKHLYEKARRGEIADFTGISSPYEPPESPDVVLRTNERPVEACVETVYAELVRRGAVR